MGKRRQARELAVQVLFYLGFCANNPDEAFDLICEDLNPAKSIRLFSKNLVIGVCEKEVELDQLISQASRNWRLERLSRLDKCVLRLAVYEILFIKDIPPKVSIDEAVEIGKKFGNENSGKFINGVLDNILNTLEQQSLLKKKEKE